jgi:hypothetical protein
VEVAETTIKRLIYCGFWRTGKAMGQVLVVDMSRNRCFFQVRISQVLRFISICDLFSDSLILHYFKLGSLHLIHVKLTPWHRFLLEKILKCSVIYGTWRIIAIFTRALQCPPVQNKTNPVRILPPYFCKIDLKKYLATLKSDKWFLPLFFWPKFVCITYPSHMCYMPHHLIIDLISLIVLVEGTNYEIPYYTDLPSFLSLLFLGANILLNTLSSHKYNYSCEM